MRDLFNALSPAVLIPPAVYAATTTPAAIDMQGFRSGLILLNVGIGGITFDPTNRIDFTLQHSIDNVTYTSVAAGDVQLDSLGLVPSGGIVRSLIAAHAAADTQKLGYIGGLRWLKFGATFGGTHGTGTPFAASILRGDANLRPV